MRTVPRRYRLGRRGGVLLLSLASGVLLIGSVTVASRADVLPASWSSTITPDAASAPTTTRPWRPTQPRDDVPPVAATPVALAIAAPPTTEAPAPTSAPPATTEAPAPTVAAAAASKAAAPSSASRQAGNAAPAKLSGPAATVVALTNDARAEAGCKPVRTDQRLTNAAQGHSSDMAENDYFAHNSQDGRTFADRIRNAGYPSPGGENVAVGQQSAAEVHEAWMNSPSHRVNIENCTYTTIGVSLDVRGMYWTQDFGR